MAVLKVKELTKKYGEGESEVIALDHVSFSVERGEFVAIIGASGSGKSTLMNMIGGIDHVMRAFDTAQSPSSTARARSAEEATSSA